MRRHEVFISHTSRQRDPSELRTDDTPAAHRHRKNYIRALIDALVEELARRSLTVWLDRRDVEASDEFEPILALGLARCATAVILVDRDALDSAFMREEAVFLGWRQAAETEFSILPVLLGDVDELAWTESGLGVAGRLNRFSALTLPGKANHRAVAEHARLIADAVPLDPPLHDPVAQRWIEDMEYFLDLVPPNVQQRAARALGIDDRTWSTLRRGSRILAAAMLHANISEGTRAFSAVRDFLSPDQRIQVGRRIIPLWVDLSAAGRLMATTRPGRSRTVGLGAGSLDLARHAVQRGAAHRDGLEIPRLTMVAGENFGEELLNTFDATIRMAVGLDAEHAPEEIEQSLTEEGIVVFVLIDTRGATAAALNALVNSLIDRFPGFIFGLVAPTVSPEWKALKGVKHPLTTSPEEDRATRLRVNRIRKLMEDHDV